MTDGALRHPPDHHLQVELQPVPLGGLGQARHRQQATLKLSEPLLPGAAAKRPNRRLAPGVHRFARLAGLAEVVGEQVRSSLGLAGEACLQGLGDAAVQQLARTPQQGAVGDILDQGVLEHIGRVRPRAPAENQVRLDQLAQGVVEVGVRALGDRRQHGPRELPADGRADLRDLLDRRQAVEPGQERGLEGGRDRDRRQGTIGHIGVIGGPQGAAVEHGAGDLLDEQRHPVGVVHDLAQDRLGQALSAGHPLDHGLSLHRPQPGERQGGDIRLTRPLGRDLELRPEGHDQHDRHTVLGANPGAEHLQRTRIGPVGVLEELDRRTRPRAGQHELHQRTDGLVLDQLRIER